MAFTGALLSMILCAITWFEADGVTPKNKPAYVWPREMAVKLLETELARDSTQKPEVVCKEQ